MKIPVVKKAPQKGIQIVRLRESVAMMSIDGVKMAMKVNKELLELPITQGKKTPKSKKEPHDQAHSTRQTGNGSCYLFRAFVPHFLALKAKLPEWLTWNQLTAPACKLKI